MFIVLLTSIVNASNHAKCVSLNNKKCDNHLLLLIYILIDTVKNYITIHFWLNSIHVSEAVIFLMTYLRMYGFKTKKEDLNMFSIWSQEKMHQKC